MRMVVCHAEPEDYEALHRIFSGSRVIEGTVRLPLPSAEIWRKHLSEKPRVSTPWWLALTAKWSGT